MMIFTYQKKKKLDYYYERNLDEWFVVVLPSMYLNLNIDITNRVRCKNQCGAGGQFGLISTDEILNNHVPHITSC